MTTYTYNVTLDDSDSVMLGYALRHYIEHCEAEIKNGKKVPFKSHKETARNFLDKMTLNARQTSGYDPDTNTIYIDT